MSTPDISVAFVAWNSSGSLATSLEAVRRSAGIAGATLDIVVVDNDSADDSVLVAEAAGADRVVRNPRNVGYVAAACQGIAVSRAPWIMLANPDLTVSEGFVGAMLEAARTAAPDVACLVPDIRYAADPSVVNSRGLEVDVLGIPFESGAGREAETLSEPVEVFGASTSGCVLRRDALAAVGGLEPLYFAYLEDVDVAWRLRKRGYRALVVPRAIAHHQGSASTGEGSWLKTFLVARNRRVLFRLHGPRGLSARLLRSATEIGHASVQALSGSGTAAVRGRAAALATRRYARYLRASNQMLGLRDAPVALSPRQTLDEALRRKRAAAALMTREDRRPATRRERRRVRPRPAPVRERPLRVLVDAANLKPGQGGIRTYSLGLIQALTAQPHLALTVATSVPDVASLGPLEIVPVSPRTQGVLGRAAWRERRLAGLARLLHADVVLTPVPELPLGRLPVPTAIVVHDVGPLIAPDYYSLPKRLRYQAFLPRTCRRASAVVCVSQATLDDLLATTRTDPARCVVIGEGPQLLGDAAEETLVDGPYVLYVGSLDPRKNVDALVDAWTGAGAALPPRLVIAGPADDRERQRLDHRLERAGLIGRVRHLGFVSPEKLTALYRDATAVALPSLYEGFGLPVLEALERRVPVVASDIPSVREVAGDGALYVSRPLEPPAWRQAIADLCRDPALQASLSERGAAASARFSWTQVGERFAELLHRVASHGADFRDADASSAVGHSYRADRRAAAATRLASGAEPRER